jgi:hypothetical protein
MTSTADVLMNQGEQYKAVFLKWHVIILTKGLWRTIEHTKYKKYL